jgi:curved DNA-binding protein CbpA
MAGDTDFLLLYDELGLAPGVSDLDALKQAYRRRVSQLHPDRLGTANRDDSDRLQRLNRLYGAALAFEQRYGRLPAAAAVTRRVESVADVMEDGPAPARNTSGHERRLQRVQPQAAPRRNRARYYFALVILLALAFAIWGVGVVTR